MKRVSKHRPYWQYSSVGDKRTRPTHAALDGKVFKASAAFWDTWYPPNGYMCRCSVNSLSERQLKKRGLKVETNDPTGGLFEPVDPVTGKKMVARPLMPDRGWDHNPGKEVYGGITPRPGDGGYKDIGTKKYTDYNRKSLLDLEPGEYGKYTEKDLLPKGLAPERYVDAFLREFGMKNGGVFTDKLGEPLIISNSFFKDIYGSWKVKKAGREKYIRLLARTVKDPYEIWLTPQKHKLSDKVVLRRRYIKAFTGDNGEIVGFAAFDYGNKEWEGVTTFTPARLGYADRSRNGILLYRK